jgi:hypothetical protein
VTTKTKNRDLWDRVWRDQQGHYVVFQWPNIPLIAWAVLTCISVLTPSRSTASTFWWLASVALAIWALLEIFRGVNYFRRALGLFVLLMLIGGAFGIGL